MSLARTLLASLAVSAGCAPTNDLPAAGDCSLPTAAIDPPVAEPIPLTGASASFDDLWFSAALDRVIAVPQGSGSVYLVDPASAEVHELAELPSGCASADATASHVFVADRGGRRILAVDPQSADIVAIAELASRPDYVRLAPGGTELWVTEPGDDRIEIVAIADGPTLTSAGFVAVAGGPEGIAFAGARAFAHRFDGPLVAIDVATREVIDTWDTGCAAAHGIPQVDETRGLVFAGCASAGGAAVLDLDDGEPLAGFEAGGGEAILAVAPALGRFYLRGDPDGELAILGVCESGELTQLARVDIAPRGHGMVADTHGNVWICDAPGGGLQRVRDPYGAP